MNILIKKLCDDAKIPVRMSKYAAGFDLYSSNMDDIVLSPGKVALIPTGISIAIPQGYEAQVRPRSGLALNYGVGILNAPGTIDADYRGEVKVILFNFGERDFTITKHLRIAQIVFTKHEVPEMVETDYLPETERGDGGFGHTKM